jgi:hypothetical protein
MAGRFGEESTLCGRVSGQKENPCTLREDTGVWVEVGVRTTP